MCHMYLDDVSMHCAQKDMQQTAVTSAILFLYSLLLYAIIFIFGMPY